MKILIQCTSEFEYHKNLSNHLNCVKYAALFYMSYNIGKNIRIVKLILFHHFVLSIKSNWYTMSCVDQHVVAHIYFFLSKATDNHNSLFCEEEKINSPALDDNWSMNSLSIDHH